MVLFCYKLEALLLPSIQESFIVALYKNPYTKTLFTGPIIPSSPNSR